ncbi:MAG: copper resistance system multicopper oxidase [Gemmatimonadaceae bacterium]|nr:copper resistance system multicopper oxidase [Gemmatimonadaceae bacterium]
MYLPRYRPRDGVVSRTPSPRAVSDPQPPVSLSRRHFLGASALVGAAAVLPGTLRAAVRQAPSLSPGLTPLAPAPNGVREYELTIAETAVRLDGRTARATTINGMVPGPVLRFLEGEQAVIRVRNTLSEDTSIHWHGILLPAEMDGVPGLSFPGIRPGQTFEYRFTVRQAGTYWYHSHSGLQEQLGHYGAIVIEPAERSGPSYDREHVLVLSDWTFEDPYRVLARLKKQPDAYNYQRRTVVDFVRDVARDGFMPTVRDRWMWAGMRMNPTDIADVTGATYSYLLNGCVAEAPWVAQFAPGERVLLRVINAAAGSYFDVRIPGVPMTVVQVSGQPVEPVATDECRVAIAETYDVIVQLPDDRAYAVYAEAMDRSGFTAATLAPRAGMLAPLPPRRRRPLLTMADMGMDHSAMAGMDHGAMAGMDHGAMDHASMGHEMPANAPPAAADREHAGHDMSTMTSAVSLRAPGTLPPETPHGADTHGFSNAMVPMSTKSRLAEPGAGLGEDGRRVLTYSALRTAAPYPMFRAPTREIEIHLTGNMERFTWAIDGVPYDKASPIELTLGERIRLTMVNDTMMNHPMHLHGMWMELGNGHGDRSPRIHTINVRPAERVSLLVTADAPGRWAFHCHVLYHMEVGMFREVHVSAPTGHEGHHDAE